MTFVALADSTRRELLRRLAHAPCRASALAEGFAISRPAICKHTRLLKKAGLIRAKKRGLPGDEDAIARGEKALPDVINILEGQLAHGRWLLGNDFTLVECDYGPVLNVIEKAGFSFGAFPKVRAYLDAIRSRPAWQETPKLPGL